MSERIRSEHPAGGMSGRSYTRKEFRAAKALGYATGPIDRPGGAIFWATGPVHLEDLRAKRDDINITLAAWEREWDKWKEATR